MELSYNITKKRMKLALFSLILCIFIPSYNYYINEIIQLNLGMGSVSAFFYIILAVIGLYSYSLLTQINPMIIIIMLVVCSGLFISYLLYPGIKDLFLSKDFNPLTSAFLFLPLMGFPMMVYTNYLSDRLSLINDYIRIPSLGLVILACIDYYWTVLINGQFFEVNYMSFSYFMLPGVCFSFSYGLIKGKIIDVIFAVLGLLVIFVTGSRGCFLCGFVFIILVCFKRYSVSIAKLFLLIIISISLVSLGSIIFPSVSDDVMSYMKEHDANSRTLSKISDGTLGESYGRNNVYKLMKQSIEEQPLGYGLMGDRYILYKHGNPGYAHSLYYEFLIDYGVVFGALLLLFVIISVILHLKRHFKHDIYYVYVLFLITGVLKLFMSGSYLEEPFFWGTLGILINSKRTR